MELRHLRYFVAVAEEGSVTRAAARLHVSQPPLSRQLRDLEAELGAALFERTAKSLALNAAGKLLLKDAREILRRCDAATQAVRAFAVGEQGQLRLGCAPGLAGDLLPETLRHFEQRHPQVRVSIHDLSTEELLQKLLARKLDLALTVPPPTDTHLTGLRFVKLKSHTLCCAASRTHPLARLRSLRAEQLRNERFVVLSPEEYPNYRRWLRSLFLSAAFEPRIHSECDSAGGLLAAVAAGQGVAIVPATYRAVAGRGVKLLPIQPALPRLASGILLTVPPARWSGDFLDVAKQLATTPHRAERSAGDKLKRR